MDAVPVKAETGDVLDSEPGFHHFSKLLSQEKNSFYSGIFPLTEKYPFVSFQSLVVSLLLYGLIVAWGLKRMWANSKPLISDGRWALRVYNTFQVVLSGYIAYLASITFLNRLISQRTLCQPMKVDIEEDRQEYELETFTCWLFYMSKWLDYMDTFFIITRSKWRQLSFLHMFHHSSMIALTWVATHYHPCGYFLIAAQLNAPVHFIMYFYYLLSSFPSLTPFLWWKNYITSVQLLQFVTGTICTLYCFCGTAMGYHSGLSLYFTFSFIMYGIILFYLFSNFYKATYSKKPKDDKFDTASSENNSKKSKKDI
jgi:hypothetical protein